MALHLQYTVTYFAHEMDKHDKYIILLFQIISNKKIT